MRDHLIQPLVLGYRDEGFGRGGPRVIKNSLKS